MMKILSSLLVLLAVAALASAVQAADPKPPKDKKNTLKGTVVKVDGTNLIVNRGKKDGDVEVTVETNDKTIILIEGKEAKLADLKAGQRVRITPNAGVAEKIEVRPPKAKKDKDK